MTDERLKLTVYFGERERAGGELLSDALFDAYERHAVRAAILLRGIEGFGAHHALRTQRLLTLSEDLPLVSVAAASRARIEELLPEVERLVGKGLVTLERARSLTRERWEIPAELGGELKLTVFVGRKERAAGGPAHAAIVDLLREHGVSGATAFLGVDGVLHGARQRARFLSRNADVPVVVVSVGSREALAAALPPLEGLLDRPFAMLERVRILKRADGGAPLPEAPDRDEEGLGVWQKLTVFAGEQARHSGHPLYVQLVRRLREAGAAGATALRGFWGYSGDHPPHGDRLLSLRRHVPVATVVIDRPAAMRSWWPIVDELTDEAGLVTCEMVPAFRALAPDIDVGGFGLARVHDRSKGDASV